MMVRIANQQTSWVKHSLFVSNKIYSVKSKKLAKELPFHRGLDGAGRAKIFMHELAIFSTVSIG